MACVASSQATDAVVTLACMKLPRFFPHVALDPGGNASVLFRVFWPVMRADACSLRSGFHLLLSFRHATSFTKNSFSFDRRLPAHSLWLCHDERESGPLAVANAGW